MRRETSLKLLYTQKYTLNKKGVGKLNMKQIIKDKSGDGYLLGTVICLIFCMILSIVMQIHEIYTIGNGVRNNLKDSIRYTVTKNWDETFGGSRQGYTGAYTIQSDDSFRELIDRNDIMAEFKQRMRLEEEQNIYKKIENGITQYQLSRLQFDIRNSSFASNSTDRFEVNSTILLQTKIKFLNMEFPVEFPLKVKTVFSPLF